MSEDRIVLHNPWTVMIADSTEETPGIIQLSRPQDWGDPRWIYKEVTLVVEIVGKWYENHAHIWIDAQIDDAELMQSDWFRECAFMVQYPGSNPKFCGRDYLAPDDFWSDDWGDLPPYVDENEDDWVPYYGG
ncbi:MAG: hypothetical protein AAFR81_30245 [Chloroflexota bacterium]